MTDDLRALAEAVKDEPDVGLRWSDIDWGLTFVPGEVAEYLIAASPDRILALLDANERLQTALRVATHSPHDQLGEPNHGFPVCSVCGAIQTDADPDPEP